MRSEDRNKTRDTRKTSSFLMLHFSAVIALVKDSLSLDEEKL